MGDYSLKVFIASGDGNTVYHILDGIRFKVVSKFLMAQNIFYQERTWSISSK